MKKKILLLFFSTILIFFTFKISFLVTEHFFFDRVFYQKSSLFGYGLHFPVSQATRNDLQIQTRIQDLTNLLAENQSSPKILGTMDAKQKIYKIVVIGDSMAYGQGVREEYIFPRLLEKKLNDIQPTQVYNLSIPGDDLIDNYTKFSLAEKNIQPDLYIITLVDNDLIFNDLNRYPQKKEIMQQLKNNCPQPDFQPPVMSASLSWEEQLQRYYFPSFSPDYSSLCLLEHVTQRMLHGKKILMTLSKYYKPEELNEKNTVTEKDLTYIMETYKTAFSEVGDFILDVNQKSDFNYTPVSSHEGHPSIKTHQLYAKYLLEEITQNPKWNFR